MAPVVRPYDAAVDEAWATEFLDEAVSGRWQVRRGELHDVLAPALGFIAEDGTRRVGLLTYRHEPDGAVELSAMAASPSWQGIGSALLEAFVAAIRGTGRARVWVVTTNDNVDALRFYQRRGFRLTALRPGAVDDARVKLKPAIGTIGSHGIPIRDELELELDVR